MSGTSHRGLQLFMRRDAAGIITSRDMAGRAGEAMHVAGSSFAQVLSYVLENAPPVMNARLFWHIRASCRMREAEARHTYSAMPTLSACHSRQLDENREASMSV